MATKLLLQWKTRSHHRYWESFHRLDQNPSETFVAEFTISKNQRRSHGNKVNDVSVINHQLVDARNFEGSTEAQAKTPRDPRKY